MDRKVAHDEEAGPSREARPTTQRTPECKSETGDVVDATVEKHAVADRVEMIEKGELGLHYIKPRGVKQVKSECKKKKKASTEEKGVNALLAKYVEELKKKEEELEKARLEIANLKRDQCRAVDNPCMTSDNARKWTEENESSTDSEDLSSGDRELDSEGEAEEEEKPLTRRQESARQRLSMDLPPFDGSPEVEEESKRRRIGSG
uniref:Uncharacterized protein n=1 Tax=Anopheles epiroticus TaxID=199890 RepID=A0A182PWK9_9DIPT